MGGDGVLLIYIEGVLLVHRAVRGLVDDAMEGRRSAVYLDHASSMGEGIDIAADSRGRGAELVDENACRDAPPLVNQLGYAILSFLCEHDTSSVCC